MDAIKLIGTSHGGKLIVEVPEEYDDKELEIMIVSSKEKNKEDEIVGAAKHPDFPITKYDVYGQ